MGRLGPSNYFGMRTVSALSPLSKAVSIINNASFCVSGRRDRAAAGPAATGDSGGRDGAALRAARPAALRAPPRALHRPPQAQPVALPFARAALPAQLRPPIVRTLSTERCSGAVAQWQQAPLRQPLRRWVGLLSSSFCPPYFPNYCRLLSIGRPLRSATRRSIRSDHSERTRCTSVQTSTNRTHDSLLHRLIRMLV